MNQNNIELYLNQYNQWKLVEKILFTVIKNLGAEGKKYKQSRYEIKNILERFLICHSNWIIAGHEKFIKRGFPWVTKMKREFSDKFNYYPVDILIDKIILLWNSEIDMQTVPRRKKINLNLLFDNDVVRFDDIFISLGKQAIHNLQLGIHQNLWTPMEVASMILKYKSHLYGSQQWGLPNQVFDQLYSDYGVKYEAFASPLNSGMMVKDKGRFCSLFLDTDRVFGSLGNFFNINLWEDGAGAGNADGAGVGNADGAGNADENGVGEAVGWIMNPPFIEDLLEKSLEKVFRDLETGRRLGKRIRVFGVMPGWYDSKFYQRLKDFWGLRYIEKLKPNKYFYESDRRIVARFESVVYVLDNMENDYNSQYTKAFDGMRWG